MTVNLFFQKYINKGSSRYATHPINTAILSCFLLSGAAGLIYQVLWVRMIDKVIGSAPFAVASVLAVFMGGLALGSYLAGKTIDKIISKGDLLSLYAKVEVAIGIYGLLVPFIIVLIKPIYISAYNMLFQHFWAYRIFTLMGCSLLLIIPTSLMGVTLPLLCRFYVIHLDHIGHRTGRLYGINTVGAAIGALLCGFFLINRIGIWGTLLVAVAINFIVGILCILLARNLSSFVSMFSENPPVNSMDLREYDSEALWPETARDPSVIWALWIFTISGFSSMAYEVIWTRLLGLMIGPTTYSFTLVVSAFIIGLAAGSLIFGWLGDRIKGVFSLLAWTQVCAALLALLVSQFLGNSQFFFAKLIYVFQDQFGGMILAQFMIVFLFLLGPTVLLGATFPLVNRIYARALPVLGRSIGTAYALNTVGAIIGSLAAGFILIPFIGKENGLRLIIALQFTLALSALLVHGFRAKKQAMQWMVLAGISVLGLAVLIHFPSWNRQLLAKGQYRDFDESDDYLNGISWFDAFYHGSKLLASYEGLPQVVFYADGTVGFTTVTKWNDSFGRVEYALLNSGKADASSHGDRATQTLLAHVPLLFHTKTETAMVLGLASGMTAGEVLLYPVKQLDVLEINDQVVRASDFFKPWNNDCLSDTRTRVIVQDGRNHLALTREKYDVIISEPSNPWMAGLANLFTLEFFQTVKNHLNGNGIFVQWIHSYEMDWPTFSMIGRTFAEVFPNGLLMTTTPVEQVDYLLVGFSGPKVFDLETARNNIKYLRRSGNISLNDPILLFHFIVTEDLKRFFGHGPLHTDNRPRLEFAAPKYLYKDDSLIEEKLEERRPLSPQTQKLVEDGNRIDVLLDLLEFSTATFSDLPMFSMADYEESTPRQKQRYRSIIRGYCTDTPVDDYEVFPTEMIRRECAELQSIKIRQYLSINPGDDLGYSQLGLVFMKMGKTEEAIRAWQRAVAMDPLDFNTYNNLGLAFVQMGDSKQAIYHYSEALRVQPEFTYAHNNLGTVLARLGKFEEAVEHFSKVLRIKPDDVDAHYNMGLALSEMGNVEQAIHHYSEALRFHPDHVDAHSNLGVLQLQRGNFEDAIRHYTEVLKLIPDNADAHNNLGAVFARQGSFEKAIGHFSEVLRIKPDDVDAHYNMGLALSGMGNVERAIHHYSEALKKAPENAELRNNLEILMLNQ